MTRRGHTTGQIWDKVRTEINNDRLHASKLNRNAGICGDMHKQTNEKIEREEKLLGRMPTIKSKKNTVI